MQKHSITETNEERNWLWNNYSGNIWIWDWWYFDNSVNLVECLWKEGMISSKVIEPSPLRTSSKSSKSVLTKSNSSTSSTSSSKRKEIQFPQSSLSALEDKDTYIKRRPRSHSNPTTAVKKGDSSYSPKDRLRASGAENTSSHNSKDRSTRQVQFIKIFALPFSVRFLIFNNKFL